MNRSAYFNGKFIPEESLRLHVSDLAIQRGYGVFDFFRTIDHKPFFMDDHIDRFFNSADGLHLNPGITKEELRTAIHELIDRNQIPDAAFRLTLTGGYSDEWYSTAPPNLFITHQALLPRPPAMVQNGLKLITHEHVREAPEIKSINYLTAVRLQPKIKQAGADDAIYHWKGIISELPRSNFFIVTKDNSIITPAENVLLGITRKNTLRIAAKHFTTKEQTVTIDDIRTAKEVFATSTTKQIIPIVQIDDIIINSGRPGEITRFLDEEFQKL